MTSRHLPFVALALSLCAAPVAAAETEDFVMRLGQDTTSIEHVTRDAARITVDQVGRSPKVLQRRYVYDLAHGATQHLSLTVTAPGSTTPVQTLELSVDPDSVHMVTGGGAGAPQHTTASFPLGTLIVSGNSPWAAYESEIMKFVHAKGDTMRGTMYFLGGGQSTYWYRMEKLGRDSMSLANGHLDVFHVAIDRDGHVLGVLPVSGTAKFGLTRVKSLDLAGMTAAFTAEEKAAGAMGTLSPRDSVVVTAGGAALWIDYGRPAKRGRVVYGGVVPYGEVWRTGANAATQFRTDKALDFGGVVVPAGFYTLWTIPSPDGWKLVVNGETGQWGTAHKPERDLYTIPMKTSTLPAVVERFQISVVTDASGGTLNLDWDTTRASATFAVKP